MYHHVFMMVNSFNRIDPIRKILFINLVKTIANCFIYLISLYLNQRLIIYTYIFYVDRAPLACCYILFAVNFGAGLIINMVT